MGDRFELAPDPGHQAHHHHQWRRRPDHILHEILHRAAAVALGEQMLESDLVRRSAALTAVVHVWRFVRDHLIDRQATGGGFERERSA